VPGRRITVIGDNCVDRYTKPNEAIYPGGNAVNAAMHLSRLGHKVRYAGRVGDDADGEWLLRILNRVGVDTSLVETVPGKSGVTVIELVDGERKFVEEIVGVQSPLTFSQYLIDEIAYESSFIVTTAFTAYEGGPRQHQPELAKELWFLEQSGVPVAMDFSTNLDDSLMRELGPMLEAAFVSAPDTSDEDALELARSLQALGPRILILTRGSGGSIAVKGSEVYQRKAEAIQPVDTLGAGDSFLAGFVSTLAEYKPLETCLEQATRIATEVCMHFGSYPFQDDELV